MLMPRRSNTNAKLASRLSEDPSAEVGRIVLGERSFVVALASKLNNRLVGEEKCRFEVGGLSLVVLETTGPLHHDHETADDLASRLTGRELEIAVLVAQGHPTKNIAYRLRISEWTVSTHLRRIFAKLGVYSRAAMVYRCASLIDRAAEICSSASKVERSTSRCRKPRQPLTLVGEFED